LHSYTGAEVVHHITSPLIAYARDPDGDIVEHISWTQTDAA
jgi:hypothetical protein